MPFSLCVWPSLFFGGVRFLTIFSIYGINEEPIYILDIRSAFSLLQKKL